MRRDYRVYMPAISMRLDSDLVKKVATLKSEDKSISGFVRELIEREFRARELRVSAVAYQQFLQDNPDEKVAMEEWESAQSPEELVLRKP
jgi:predicted CopG family antitoxin